MIETLTFFKSVDAHKWIPVLWKGLQQIRKDRKKDLDEIKTIAIIDPLDLAKFYVEPNCQEMNPADRRVDDEMVAKEPIMVKINQFFKQTAAQPGRNQLFILSDAGMGKSALLAMIKLMHLTRFWPNDRDCVLKKLGPGVLEEVGAIENKRETILLLDSLDEDPRAYGRVKRRLEDILDISLHFAKAIITCRTQFFPVTDQHPLELPGQIAIGPYQCYSKYLSFFNDTKVYDYLSKRLPRRFFGLMTDQKKIAAAQKIILKMGALRCRPMLLSYIEDLMASPKIESGNAYRIYDSLVDSWLRRELLKKKDIPIDDLQDACIIIAVWMQTKQIKKISETQLNQLIETISKKIKTIMQIDLKGRSLLNRNSDGDYRFSHYSIQEFCVAKFISEKPLFKPKAKIPLTNQIVDMIAQLGKPDLDIDALDLTQVFQAEEVREKITKFDMEFVYIPPGVFKMGSQEEERGREENETLHTVLLTQGFYMQTTPVTQAQWQAVMNDNPSKFKRDGERPVETVSWEDAWEFIKTLNEREGRDVFSLPTEAQWEYASRAGTRTRYYTGDEEAELDRAGWYGSNADGQTHPVAQKEPNAFGLYDMLGNVWEWCQDWEAEYPRSGVIDPCGPSSGTSRVLRGGSCSSLAVYCRAADRHRTNPDSRYFSFGFRLVRLPGQ